MTEYIVIKDRSNRLQAKRKKTMVLPSKRSQIFSRRKHGQVITFYDCASVKDGLTYRDHPILKTPGYSYFTDPDNPAAQAIFIDPFTADDYTAYRDLLFEIPIEEWKDNYRKLEFELAPPLFHLASPATYPTTLSERSSSTAQFMQDLAADISTVFGQSERRTDLADPGICWTSKGLEYRGLSDLNFRPTSGTNPEWFSTSLVQKGEFNYKVTATLDSSATDVGDLTVSGNIDVYLIPHVGQYMAVSPDALPFFTHVNVLGPVYQVLPRHLWPTFVKPYENPFIGPTDRDAFLAYQKGRVGMQASVYFGSAIAPADFNYTYWQQAIDNTGVETFTELLDSGGSSISVNRGSSDPDDPTHFFTSIDPILMAVIKMHGQFYYVWSGPADPDFPQYNRATTESFSQSNYSLIRSPANP